jgi:CMP-N-acetylneuraminic acid synthetase
MRFLGIIPARGGSKGIPNKCITPCAGNPLLFYTVREAKISQRLNRIILSTDSEPIATVGRNLGVEVPFLRPENLAQDDSAMIGVLQHSLNWMKAAGENFDAIVLLQPTSPLRQARHIDEAIDLFVEKGADTVVSVTEVPHQFNPVSLMKIDDGRLSSYLENSTAILRRQDKPILFARNGPSVLVVRAALIGQGCLYGDATYGYIMASKESYDIDSLSDLELVETLLRTRV